MSGLPPRAARIRGIDAIAVDIPLSRNFGGSTYSVPKLSTEGDGHLSTAARSDARARARPGAVTRPP